MKNLFLALSMVLIGSAAKADVTIDPEQFNVLETGSHMAVSSQDFNDLSTATYSTTKKLAETLDQHEWAINRGFKETDRKMANLALGEGKLATRVAELERVVRGLQKQVTILHSKKADK